MYRVIALAASAMIWFGAPAVAEPLPGPVDEAIIGAWQCGETRVYITLLGSIELVGDDYTAGLMRAENGMMRIEWDHDSTRSEWAYAAGNGDLRLVPADSGGMTCHPRD